MNNELFGFVVLTFLGGILSLILCIYAYLNIKNTPGGKYYIVATLLASFFTFSYGFELLSYDLEQIKFWVRMEYLALPLIPVFILLMCLDYVGKKLNRIFTFVLFGIPFVTMTLHLTNDFHHLYYSSVSLKIDSPYPIVELEPGFGFVIHSVFLYGVVAVSVVVLLLELRTLSSKLKQQILLMITGVLIPIIASVFYITGLSPNGVDIGPVSMCFSFVFHGIALLSYKMFDITPIARERIFESIDEGVLVLNQNNIIVDYNQAMINVLPVLKPSYIGQKLDTINVIDSTFLSLAMNETETDYHYTGEGNSHYYQVKFTPVLNSKNILIGKIMTFTDVTKRVLLEEQLKRLASTDGLTNIYNRAFFVKSAEEYLNIGTPISVIMFDIDHFKKVNDTYGHVSGDAVLCNVVEIVKSCLREEDLFGRFGGEEFLICLAGTIDEAMNVAHSIKESIQQMPTVVSGHCISVTSSFGVTNTAFTERELSVQALISQADQALYVAKQNGRNCVVSFKQPVEVS